MLALSRNRGSLLASDPPRNHFLGNKSLLRFQSLTRGAIAWQQTSEVWGTSAPRLKMWLGVCTRLPGKAAARRSRIASSCLQLPHAHVRHEYAGLKPRPSASSSRVPPGRPSRFLAGSREQDADHAVHWLDPRGEYRGNRDQCGVTAIGVIQVLSYHIENWTSTGWPRTAHISWTFAAPRLRKRLAPAG